MALEGWHLAKDRIKQTRFSMIILDELTYLITAHIIDIKEVVRVLEEKPLSLHIVITGRDAPEELIKVADITTEMKEIKHSYKQGVKAQKGIEF